MAFKNKDGNKKKHTTNFQFLISDLKSAQQNWIRITLHPNMVFFFSQNLTPKVALCKVIVLTQRVLTPGIGIFGVLRKHCSEASGRQSCLIKIDLLRQKALK